jgi:hypothetical protein
VVVDVLAIYVGVYGTFLNLLACMSGGDGLGGVVMLQHN